jgi:transcriptional regulator with XRE-family HTH domain
MTYRENRFTPNRLREQRLKAKLSLKELARRVGVAASTVSRHETGARRVLEWQLTEYATVLRLCTEDLL